MIPLFAKRFGLAAAAKVRMQSFTRRILRDCGVIFMLHRFRDPDVTPGLTAAGHDPTAVRRSLDYLRRHRYELVSLEELLRRLTNPEPRPRGAIAFTIDDGYRDQAAIGAPIFAEFDCPVTTFVATGFLDGSTWFWWDHVEYIFAQTKTVGIRVRLGEQVLAYPTASPLERERGYRDFISRCKTVPEEEKQLGIALLASTAEVTLPARPPEPYAPMTWDQLRTCERAGMSFAPHTVTHPVLSRIDDQQSEHEIAESWRRLRAEAAAPLPVFCYPNGQQGEYTRREFETLVKIGMQGAVAGFPGYADAGQLMADDHARFEIPRFAWTEEDVPMLAQFASGLERVKQILSGSR